MQIQLKVLTPNDKDAFRTLLGSTDFGGCFCAVWTSYGDDWEKRCLDSSQPNYFITTADLKRGRHVGFLVYLGDQLIGWTGSGPKSAFPLMKTKLGSRLSEFTSEVWSIGCIAVSSEFRGQNLSEKIVRAVIDEARSRSAKAVEAYPVCPFHEPRMYRGSYNLFKRLGFVEVGSEKDADYEILLLKYALNG